MYEPRRVLSVCAVAAAVAVSFPRAAHAEQIRPAVPVLVGGQEPAEGCEGTSIVTIRAGTLNLRSGPGLNHRIIGRLSSGQITAVCQRVRGGWVGILVLPDAPAPRDCKVSDVGPKPKAYTGPCVSGWVLEKYLRMKAG